MRKTQIDSYVTKQILQQELQIQEARIDLKMDNLEQRIDDKAQLYRDQVLTAIDGVMKELVDIRENSLIRNNQIEDHELRLKKIENN